MTNHNMHTQALWKHTEEKKPRGCNNSNTIESADQMTKAVEEWTHKKSCPSIEVMNFVAEFCFTVFRLPFGYSNFVDWMCNGRNFSENEPIDCEVSAVQFSFSWTSNLFDSYTVDPSSPSLLSKQWNMSFVFFFFHSTRIRVH